MGRSHVRSPRATGSIVNALVPQTRDLSGGRSGPAVAFFQWFARRKIAGALDGVYIRGLDTLRGALADGPVIVALNHASWWDILLIIWLDGLVGADARAVMDAGPQEVSQRRSVPCRSTGRTRTRAGGTSQPSPSCSSSEPPHMHLPARATPPDRHRPLGLKAGVRFLAAQAGACHPGLGRSDFAKRRRSPRPSTSAHPWHHPRRARTTAGSWNSSAHSRVDSRRATPGWTVATSTRTGVDSARRSLPDGRRSKTEQPRGCWAGSWPGQHAAGGDEMADVIVIGAGLGGRGRPWSSLRQGARCWSSRRIRRSVARPVSTRWMVCRSTPVRRS